MPNVLDEMDEVIQTLIPQLIHTTPPNDDYVAPATKSILDEFDNKIMNVTMVDEEGAKDPQSYFTEIHVHSVITKPEPFIHTQPLSPLYGVFKTSKPCKCILVNELCGYVRWKPSRDFTRLLGPPSGLKGLFHTLNATVIPTKLYRWLVKSPMMLNVARGSKLRAWL
ncbi:hypothetical protein Tco_1502114 [Tanacetum coccineum]